LAARPMQVIDNKRRVVSSILTGSTSLSMPLTSERKFPISHL
jgi:hypothetical protein